MLKEENIKEIVTYKDSLSMWSEACIALSTDGKKENGLTIGWGGIGVLWRKPCCTIYINEARYSRKIFSDGTYFTVCFLPSEYKEELKFFGTKSGRDIDKLKETSLTVDHIEGCPYFLESEMVLVCKKMTETKFNIDDINKDYQNIIDWYSKDGVHTIYYGEIIKVLKK